MTNGMKEAMQLSAILTWAVSAASGAQPKWAPTWDMASSTLFMPCNYSGFLDPSISAKWGVVDFDWSNAKGAWTRQHPMDCEERLVAQADLVRSANPDAKVWVYRNLVKALPWCELPQMFLEASDHVTRKTRTCD